MSDYAMPDGIDVETMSRIYKYCKEKEDDDDMPFMKICTYECPPDKKISKNFLEYIDPFDFVVTKKKKGKKTIDDSSESESDSD
jgi:hypothetical protein